MLSGESGLEIPALKVRQWLAEWNQINFDPSINQAKPKEHFYLLSIPASKLRTLAGIYRRETGDGTPRSEDMGIQRRHDPDRSLEIRRYVTGGYPWSELSESKRKNPLNDNLRKPGWLPTAVVVNVLQPGDLRRGQTLREQDAVSVLDRTEANIASVTLPNFDPSDGHLPPLEVIDGQHRLYAFDNEAGLDSDYELPVVAFHGLDLSWQAYLFWTINIKPKKINASLAFDLYPLLREQEWLERGDVVLVYRESRAQELTEMLWSTPESPWFRRINMLGGPRKDNGPVTQAAFIRSLTASMVKSWKPGRSQGGIFGGSIDNQEGLAWSRLQQSAFLLTAWRMIARAVNDAESPWAVSLRQDASENGEESITKDHTPFSSQHSLLATDQGVRGFQSIINDLCYIHRDALHLDRWRDSTGHVDVHPDNVAEFSRELEGEPVYDFLEQICESLSSFDWRSSGAPGLSSEDRLKKAALRGSGGYKELRVQLMEHLRRSAVPAVAAAACVLEN